MTPEELKALVAAKIAGQGTNVDAGGGLPEILNGIIDLIGSIPAPTQDIVVVDADVSPGGNVEFVNRSEVVAALLANKIVYVHYTDGSGIGMVVSASMDGGIIENISVTKDQQIKRAE